METPRFTGEWPPPSIWDEYPNWEYALDEEDIEGQDETTLCPSANVKYIDADTVFSAGDAQLANGEVLPALIELMSDEIVGIDVFVTAVDTWRVYLDPRNGLWKSFTQDWLPIEERQPSVALTDTRVFPLSVESRLSRASSAGRYRIVIRSDGVSS